MRRIAATALVAHLVIALAVAAAQAQPRIATPMPPPADVATPIPSIAEDRAAAAALNATLTAIDAQISTDEVRMTQLRDSELAGENARLRAVRPAMSFHGPVLR